MKSASIRGEQCYENELNAVTQRLAEAETILSRALDCSDKLCNLCLARIEAFLSPTAQPRSADLDIRHPKYMSGVGLKSNMDEATEPEMVCVRCDDLRLVDYLFCRKSLPLVGEDREAGYRLQVALDRGKGRSDES